MKNKKIIALLIAIVMAVALFTACTNTATTASEATTTEAAAASTEAAATTSASAEGDRSNIQCELPVWYNATAEMRELAKVDVPGSQGYAAGQFGDKAVDVSEVSKLMTDENIQKIKDAKLTAAICMGFTGDDWSAQIVRGLREECEALGIEVIAETQADFKDTKQISDMEAVSAQKPDMLFSIPVNPQTETAAFKKLTEQGIKVVFIDQQCADMEPGKDFVSVVSSGNYELGLYIADELAKFLGGKGDVAALYYAPDYYVTNVRYEGFVERLVAKYPDMKLIATNGFQDWQKAQDATAAMLTKYPSITGMYASWDVPAVGAVAAAKLSGKDPKTFGMTIEDLGNEMALNMAQGGFIKGVGAQLPAQQGRAEVDCAALACIGETPPTFVVVPGLDININNLDTAYEVLYDMALPEDIVAARNKTLGIQ